VTVPLLAGDRVLGSLGFARPAADGPWSDELRQRLHLVGEVFANALARKETEDALRASEAMKSAILGSLTNGVAVLDRDGWIIAVNEGWTQSACETDPTMVAVGVSYLAACRQAARRDTPHAAEILAGVQAVLAHARPAFAMEYAPDGRERWFALSVVPLDRPEGGAVMSQTDVTERKQAEMDAQRSRQELAHFTRVSTMGELAASLAHELNQPLAGILINAEAARRLLDATPPATSELRDTLSDIIDDDTRAAEVIQRLRDLLRKGDSQRVLLDLNLVVRDVIRLVSSDAVIRNVTVTLECSPEPICVRGDRVQLQQVVLNLLLNAMEAVADGAPEHRTIVVRTERTPAAVHVSVQDAGPGLREGTNELVFEPFYTTKPTGMGMGLSIVRSIIRMHDGVVSATNNPTRGATFRCTLPFAVADTAP
jgi:C4-dicarboxylate-specific signal transduction histidine kinase